MAEDLLRAITGQKKSEVKQPPWDGIKRELGKFGVPEGKLTQIDNFLNSDEAKIAGYAGLLMLEITTAPIQAAVEQERREKELSSDFFNKVLCKKTPIEAVEIFNKFKDPTNQRKVVEQLVALMLKAEASQDWKTTNTISSFFKEEGAATTFLLEAMKGKSSGEQLCLWRYLPEKAREKANSYLRDIVKDKNVSLRDKFDALHFLKCYGGIDKSILPALLKLTRDNPNQYVTTSVVISTIGKMKGVGQDKEVIDLLLKTLKNKTIGNNIEENSLIRSKTAKALRNLVAINDESAKEIKSTIMSILDSETENPKSTYQPEFFEDLRKLLHHLEPETKK